MYASPTYNDLMAVAQAGAVPREEAEQKVRHAGTPSETGPDVRQAGSEPGLNLKQLVRAIAKALRRKDACQEELSVQLQDLLRNYDASIGDWKRYALFDEKKHYTRNLISTDRESYTLMLLCWTAAKESPIHDHPCDGCWMRCIQGGITETRYAMPDTKAPSGPLQQTRVTTLHCPEVAYIDDNLGLHKVAATEEGPAITLHLYAPPFSQCRVWLYPENPARILKPVVTFHSEHGSIVQYDDPTSTRDEGCSITDVEGQGTPDSVPCMAPASPVACSGACAEAAEAGQA